MEIEFLESLVQNIGPIIVILNCYYLEATGSFECPLRWPRLSEQIFRLDKWSLCRG